MNILQAIISTIPPSANRPSVITKKRATRWAVPRIPCLIHCMKARVCMGLIS